VSKLLVKVVNLYNDRVEAGSKFQKDHGQSFLISTKDQKILFDTGATGKYLLGNMKKLGIDPNEIDIIILSHGHFDHTGGIPALAKARTRTKPLTIIAHPLAMSPKGGIKKVGGKEQIVDFGFPKLSDKIRKKLSYVLVTEPYKVTPFLYTLGEITERPHKDGISKHHVYECNGTWQPEKMLDDLSIVLKTQQGQVLICGCCHAGLLNTLLRVSTLYPNEKIHSILGGTHMFEFTGDEVDFVAKGLKEQYNTPLLYLNHCTGVNTIDQLTSIFGDQIVGRCFVGDSFEYKC